ncbi:NAD(P)/FAD-dependent oxidoreductase [Anabaena sp. FACHB-1237]|uniref:dihydrolipoyl dehydrogenase family protein n=1 Tax=Anabaena sp. FACHB-1237 TaxID=2692769 RepID=UPI001681035D|nr:NAD(P)/FAD-dependent oxidoreductase [Anabaena sp. FACHB-1237]MBD2138393.1 NAD(P)/FAD-dependent oxidoreductase [Anabaena sp. FACHB-1237]
MIDYDLVIIGGTFAAYQAALIATEFRAKVALVVNSTINNHPYYQYYPYIFQQIKQIKQINNIKVNHIQENIEKQYIINIAKNIYEINSLDNLMMQGVDIITDHGQFTDKYPLEFTVNQRKLKARNYLLANGSIPTIPQIKGLENIAYLTINNIWQYIEKHIDKNALNKHFAIIGGTPQSIEIAQILANLGSQITLILNNRNILNYIDTEIAQLLIAQLEINGIQILTDTIVTQIREIDGKKWLQAGNKAIETDEIIIAINQEPNIQSLNLKSIGVKYNQQRLMVNKKLQSSNHRVYACGDVIGGYNIPSLGNYEANIAVKNALFLPIHEVNYQTVIWGIYCQPNIAHIGLTANQAKGKYPANQILELKQYFKTNTAAQITGENTGVCKLVVLENGQILGCCIFGSAATEIINIMALLIAKNLKVAELANIAPIYPSFSEILVKTAREWQNERMRKNHILQELLASFFNFRRDINF